MTTEVDMMDARPKPTTGRDIAEFFNHVEHVMYPIRFERRKTIWDMDWLMVFDMTEPELNHGLAFRHAPMSAYYWPRALKEIYIEEHDDA